MNLSFHKCESSSRRLALSTPLCYPFEDIITYQKTRIKYNLNVFHISNLKPHKSFSAILFQAAALLYCISNFVTK